MPFKFENLEVWRLTQDYIALLYTIAGKLPHREQDNLGSQLRRAAVSIGLNIAEGSTGQTNPQQVNYVRTAIGSLNETVACLLIIRELALLSDGDLLDQAYQQAETIVAKLHNLRKSISGYRKFGEEEAEYQI